LELSEAKTKSKIVRNEREHRYPLTYFEAKRAEEVEKMKII